MLPDQIAVVVIFDGIEKVHYSLIEFFEELDKKLSKFKPLSPMNKLKNNCKKKIINYLKTFFQKLILSLMSMKN